MPNYTQLRMTAERLIRKSGRPVVLSFTNDSTEFADPLRPWLGVDQSDETPRPLNTFGVFVNVESAQEFSSKYLGTSVNMEEMARRSSKICMVPSPLRVDFTRLESVTDDGVFYGVEGVHELKPGPLSLIAFVGLKR